jgi:hypothetical protein
MSRSDSGAPRWRRFGVVALLAGVIAVGCSGQKKMEGLVPAYGHVTLDGEPLADAQVIFDHPQHPETFGRTDSSGYYKMEYTAHQSGAFVGKNKVSFSTGDEEIGKPETIPAKYRTKKSKLTVDITDGGAPYDFDLKSN